MVTPYIKLFVNGALLLLLLSTASAKDLPTNCVEAVQAAGANAKSGIYQIRLPIEGAEPFYVYCLLDPKGGDPWLLVQRRQNSSIDFNRDVNDYEVGFGNLATSFFIGLNKLHELTQVQLHELQIELHDFNDTVKYANYESFAVGGPTESFALNILGAYSGTAGDSLLNYHEGEKFYTSADVPYIKGGWWCYYCKRSNLNGEYQSDKNDGHGIVWASWRGEVYSLKYAHMAIRPIVLSN